MNPDRQRLVRRDSAAVWEDASTWVWSFHRSTTSHATTSRPTLSSPVKFTVGDTVRYKRWAGFITSDGQSLQVTVQLLPEIPEDGRGRYTYLTLNTCEAKDSVPPAAKRNMHQDVKVLLAITRTAAATKYSTPLFTHNRRKPRPATVS